MWKIVLDFWWLAALLAVVGALWASGHAVLYKRDVRAAVGWVGFIWIAPFMGPLAYLLFGINRIQRRAGRKRRNRPRLSAPESELRVDLLKDTHVLGGLGTLASLENLVGQLVDRPLLRGNHLEPLYDGDAAYAAMCGAIREAQHSVSMVSYIFDNDRAGAMFVEAFKEAAARGVAVRVLVDAVGRRYSWKPIDTVLAEEGVPAGRFMQTFLPWKMTFANLRNHRKILVVDGRLGFTGGMNIREGHMPSMNSDHPIQDMHFSLRGPIVGQLQEVFAEDWAFTTGEILEGDKWFPALSPEGEMLARGIADGPDEDFDKLRWALLGALACARSSVRIMTPYFLPDPPLISSLNVAAMRGVQVEILLPEKNNLAFVQWASTGMLWQVLQQGCRVYAVPPPFDHSKLMVVDGVWALIGSANWDPRSLRLNFEFNVEVYDRALAGELHDYMGQKIALSREISLDDLAQRPMRIQLRDGIARLFSPYM